MNNPTVFDLMDNDPTLAGMTAAILLLLTFLVLMMLGLLKDLKEAKGPFDGY